MKAVVYHEYGSPDVLRLRDVDRPLEQDHDVLVKVHAASVNQWDWDFVRGRPLLVRLGGWRKPQYHVLGADIAGVVAAVGAKVTRFQPGDEVFGDISGSGWGGFAEYAVAGEDALASKPAGLSFEEAAAVPQAAVLALSGLRKGRVRSGHTVLINGAGGGVGTFAVQMAKSLGAEVTGVDRSDKLAMVRAIGADHVIDYTHEDFTRNGRRYDLILDVTARRSVFACERTLNRGGHYVLVGGSTAALVQVLLLGALMPITRNKTMCVLMHTPNAELAAVSEFLASGQVAPIIDRCYPLSQVAEAVRYLGEGNARGKVVITVSD